MPMEVLAVRGAKGLKAVSRTCSYISWGTKYWIGKVAKSKDSPGAILKIAPT